MAQSQSFKTFAASQATLLAAYRALDFSAADAAIAEARALAPAHVAGLYDVYATRLAAMRLDPPAADWDGVFVARQK